MEVSTASSAMVSNCGCKVFPRKLICLFSPSNSVMVTHFSDCISQGTLFIDRVAGDRSKHISSSRKSTLPSML
jgi:hypothetical protein